MANYFGRIWRGAMLFAGSGATLAMVAMSYDDDRGAENANNLRASTQWDDNWDRRAPPPDAADSTDGDKPTKATASRHLILIRHGQYDHRYDLAHKPDELRVLTQLGHQQATITGKRLKELQAATGSGYNALIHSSLKRAIETTIDIIPSLEVVPPVSSCDLLIEGLPCKPDPGQPVSWKNRHKFYQEGARIEAAFRKYFYRANPEQKSDTTDIIVCHANVIRYFVCRALQLPPEAWLRMSLAHCSITRITIRPNGRVTLKGLGDAGHLPANMITYS
ncbi:serine/threonine-protein phosphatase PGAM5, mitochondrial-like isoform X1 [Dysidea avara]|uniref:serine/threonine-protein phosphatase PGAM5, mitochondrial-like isoform X1 n=1 Tax=Dysidea avara TaxID=196820 RepID=UPI0033212D16